jgi:hypothetical protein
VTPLRVSVDRGETTYEATIRWSGSYAKATRLDPEEFPEPAIDEAWRDGVKLRPDFLPDDVTEEILDRATDPDMRDYPASACDAGTCGHCRC